MDYDSFKNIHFNDVVYDEFFDVDEETLFGFLIYRIIKSRSGEPFSFLKILGPYHSYNSFSLDNVDVLSLTFVRHKESDRPFAVIIEKTNNTKKYYGMLDHQGIEWKQLEEINGIPEEFQQKLLIDVFKSVFYHFHMSEIWLNQDVIKQREYKFAYVKYTVISDINCIDGYDMHHIKQDTTHSVSRVLIYNDEMNIDVDLRFVDRFYFYYVHGEDTTPLMMETVDYSIDGSLALYNYYIPKYLKNKWVPVECATHLLEPKCKSDLKMILDQLVEEYRENSITLDIRRPPDDYKNQTTIKLGDTRFNCIYEEGEYYVSYYYGPRVTKSFFVDKLLFNEVEQEIDIGCIELESIYIYYRTDNTSRPLLICIKLHDRTNSNKDHFIWFYMPDFFKNKWLTFKFDADPNNDKMLIEEKMKAIYPTNFSIDSFIFPIKSLAVFSFGGIIGIYLGAVYRRSLRLAMLRLYHYIRR